MVICHQHSTSSAICFFGRELNLRRAPSAAACRSDLHVHWLTVGSLAFYLAGIASGKAAVGHNQRS